MSMYDEIDKIEKVSSVSNKQGVDPIEQTGESQFEQVMKTAEPSKDLQAKQTTEVAPTTVSKDGVQKPSLMDEVQSAYRNSGRRISTEDLVASLNSTQERLTTLKSTLTAKKDQLTLAPEVSKTLEKKLTNVDDSLTIASQRVRTEAGLESLPSTEQPFPDRTFRSPIEKFFGFVTDSEYKLKHITDDVQSFAVNGKELSPASMLLVQIKVGYIQQELEFFTNILNKSLESTKTIMNVQV